jgi:hypothetical protein
MNIEVNQALPLNRNAFQQSSLNQNTLRKLREQSASNPCPIPGAREIVWNEAENIMRKDGFEKLALVKDSTLSGIVAEYSPANAQRIYKELCTDALGDDGASALEEFHTFCLLTDENKDAYNIYQQILFARCKAAYEWGDAYWENHKQYIDVGGMLHRENPGLFNINAEKIRTDFADTMDAFSKKLREDHESGAISEEEYQNRQKKLNEAYDLYAYDCGNRGMLDYYYVQAYYGTDVFSSWEGSLNDIKTRYERGDFGFEEGVYEERVAAWSAAFDAWAGGPSKPGSPPGSELVSLAEMVGNEPLGFEMETKLFREDMRKLYANAKAHLLSGGAASDLTDDILNEGLLIATAADRRFFRSKEYGEMKVALDRQSRSVINKEKTQSQDKKEWEELYAGFAKTVNSLSMGETLRSMLLYYFEFAAARLPILYKGNFLPG